MAKFTNELTIDVRPFLEALKKATAAAGGDIAQLEKTLQGLEADITIEADTSQAKRAIEDVAAEARGIADAQVAVDVNAEPAKKALSELDAVAKVIAGKIQEQFAGLGNGLGSVLLSAFAGAGLVDVASGLFDAVSGSLGAIADAGRDAVDAQVRLKAATGASGAEFEALQAAAENAFVKGVGESLTEASDVIAKTQNLLGDAFDPQQIGEFVAQSSALGSLYDKDINEVIQKSSTFIKQFGLDSTQASNLVALGLQDAGTAQDDFLDSLSEYSQLAKEAGFSAEEFVGLITRGGEEGVFNTDKIADSLKEAQIRLQAGDITKAITDLGTNVPAALGKSISEIVKLGESGQLSVQEVLQQTAAAVETSFAAGEIGPNIRSQLQVAIAGTPAEDLGADLYGRIFGAPIDTAKVTENAAAAGQAASLAVGQNFSFDAVARQLELQFIKVSGVVVGGLSQAFGTIVELVSPALERLANAFSQYWNQIKDIVLPILSVIGGGIIAGIVTAVNLVTEALRIVVSVATAVFSAIRDAIAPVLEAFGLFGEAGADSVDFIGIFKSALSILGSVLETVADIITTVFTLAIEAATIPLRIIGSIAGTVIDWFKKLFGITGDLGGVFNSTGSFVERVGKFLDMIKDSATGVVYVFVFLKDRVAEFFAALASFDLQKALAAFSGLGDGIAESFSKGRKIAKTAREESEAAEAAAEAAAIAEKKRQETAAKGGKTSTKQATELQKALGVYKEIEANQRVLLEQELKRIELRQDLSDEEKKALGEIEKARAAATLQDEAQKVFKATIDEFGLFVGTALKLTGSETENEIRAIFTRLAQDRPEIPVVIAPETGARDRVKSAVEGLRLAVPIELPVGDGETDRVESSLKSLQTRLADGLKSIFKTTTDTQADELEKQSDNLKAQLKRNEISYQEYNGKLSEIDAQRTTEADLAGKALGAVLGSVGAVAGDVASESFAKVGKSADAAYKLATEGAKLSTTEQETLKNETLDIGATFGELGIAAGATFAQMVADGASASEALSAALKQTLKAVVQAFIPTIFANYLAFIPPPFNAVAAAAAVALLNGLIDQYLAFEQGGLVPGGEQLIRVNEAGQEFVMNAKATKKYGPMLEAMNSGRDIGMVGSDVVATLDNRLERVEMAIRGLGQEISRRTRVEGELVFAGGAKTLVGTFDTMSTYNKRRKLK